MLENQATDPPPRPVLAPVSPLEPLSQPTFRMLWLVWLTANTCMWMNDVATAWLMSSLTTSPLWVALVQTAATMPVFLLGLPSGAVADMVDRRRLLIGTQIWIASVAMLLCAAVFLDLLNAPLLLVLTFASGVGLALRWPVYSAVVPEAVPRIQLPAAMALNGISMNASRIVGPLIAGSLIASVGTGWVFVLNAVLASASAVLLLRWKREHKPSPHGREKLASAMRVGVQYVAQSPRLRSTLAQVSLFFFNSTALIALLPLVARNLPGGGAGTYTALLASMGVGAIVSALNLQRIQRLMSRRRLVMLATLVQSLAVLAVAWSPSAPWATVAMSVSGGAWIICANTLGLSAQFALPDWVRARGMATYQMAIMGGSAAGAAVWGQVATATSITTSLSAAACVGTVLMAVVQRLMHDPAGDEDLSPSRGLSPPRADMPVPAGRVTTHIEFRVDPAHAYEFEAFMHHESRRSRLRQGALEWRLIRDITDPGRYVEEIVDESWTEHLRRFDRLTAADMSIRDRRQSFHVGEDPPRATRWVEMAVHE